MFTQATEDIQIFVYETEILEGVSPASRLVDQIERLPGVSATIFGQGEHFDGYGSKYSAVMPILKELSPETLVVLSDSRDVLLNNPAFSGQETMASAVEGFRAAFDRLTEDHPHAVVVSAEAQCCVSALTFVEPGDYFAEDGSRQQRACSSGASGCGWNGDDKAEPWENFMQTMARERTDGEDFDDVYLNAGLMVGKAENLVRLIEAIALDNKEDDQAVLTDYMYVNNEAIVLDYGQTLFGNNRAGEQDNCVFHMTSTGALEEHRLVHTKTGTSPLFVHSPGSLLKCHEELAEELGIEQVSRSARRRLTYWDTGKGDNYKGGKKHGGWWGW